MRPFLIITFLYGRVLEQQAIRSVLKVIKAI